MPEVGAEVVELKKIPNSLFNTSSVTSHFLVFSQVSSELQELGQSCPFVPIRLFHFKNASNDKLKLEPQIYKCQLQISPTGLNAF